MASRAGQRSIREWLFDELRLLLVLMMSGSWVFDVIALVGKFRTNYD